MDIFLYELRQSIRGILAKPAFSLLVVAVLGAGLACVIFMLIMIRGYMRPPPFAAPDELLQAGIYSNNERDHFNGNDPGFHDDNDFLQIRRRLHGLADVAAYSDALIRLSDLGQPEIRESGIVSTNLFRMFGVAPLLGRDFVEDDGRDGAPAVVMLSYRLWRDRYAGDPAIIGRQVRVNSLPTTVIGVMPEEYGYPGREALWIPAVLSEGKNRVASDWGMNIVLRRAPKAGNVAIRDALETWFADAARASPDRLRNQHVVVEALSHTSPRERLFYVVMFAASILVLLIACANVANLLMTRALGRRQELGVRVALGASRSRLALHLLLQSLLLSLIASALALLLATFAAAWQEAAFAQSQAHPPWQHFSLDPGSALFVIGIAVLTASASGLLPALHIGRDALAGPLRDDARSVGAGSFARISRVLVIGEIALSCVLLLGVGTMLRAIDAVEHAPLGIDENHLLGAKFDLTANAYPTAADQLRLYERLVDRVRADAEIVDASVGQIQPGVWSDTLDALPAGADAGSGAWPPIYYGATDAHGLAAFGMHLQEGRFFDSRDRAGSEPVAVVDRRFAERFGNGQSVIGRRFRVDSSDPDRRTVTVVGVVDNLILVTPQEPKYPSLLVPLSQSPNAYGIVSVRTHGDAKAYLPRLTSIMHALDPDIPLYGVGDYAHYNQRNTRHEREDAQWFGSAGLIALIIAAAGLYGVMAFMVGQRTREIGLRRALGASRSRILHGVLARAAWQVGVGLALGLLLGLPFARLLTRYANTLEVHDPRVMLGTCVVLIAAAALAVTAPALRALRVDPMIALRNE